MTICDAECRSSFRLLNRRRRARSLDIVNPAALANRTTFCSFYQRIREGPSSVRMNAGIRIMATRKREKSSKKKKNGRRDHCERREEGNYAFDLPNDSCVEWIGSEPRSPRALLFPPYRHYNSFGSWKKWKCRLTLKDAILSFRLPELYLVTFLDNTLKYLILLYFLLYFFLSSPSFSLLPLS